MLLKSLLFKFLLNIFFFSNKLLNLSSFRDCVYFHSLNLLFCSLLTHSSGEKKFNGHFDFHLHPSFPLLFLSLRFGTTTKSTTLFHCLSSGLKEANRQQLLLLLIPAKEFFFLKYFCVCKLFSVFPENR